MPLGDMSIDSEVASPRKNIKNRVSRFGKGTISRECPRSRSRVSDEPSSSTLYQRFGHSERDASDDLGTDASPLTLKRRNQELPPIHKSSLGIQALKSPSKERTRQTPILDFRLQDSKYINPWEGLRSSKVNITNRKLYSGSFHAGDAQTTRELSERYISDRSSVNNVLLTDRIQYKKPSPKINPLAITANRHQFDGRGDNMMLTPSKSVNRMSEYKPQEVRTSLAPSGIIDYEKRIRQMRQELAEMNRICGD